jgi:hypothetical protein
LRLIRRLIIKSRGHEECCKSWICRRSCCRSCRRRWSNSNRSGGGSSGAKERNLDGQTDNIKNYNGSENSENNDSSDSSVSLPWPRVPSAP